MLGELAEDMAVDHTIEGSHLALRHTNLLHCIALCWAALTCGAAQATEPAPGANPVLRDRFTADPAPLVVGDTVYLYVGREAAQSSARRLWISERCRTGSSEASAWSD